MVTDLEFMTQLHSLSKNIIKIIFKDNELSPKLFGGTTATNNQTNYQESSTEKTKKRIMKFLIPAWVIVIFSNGSNKSIIERIIVFSPFPLLCLYIEPDVKKSGKSK